MSALLDDGVSKHAQKRLGTWLCGRYRITRLIGVGGMAAVYAGVHRNGHVVAIKILYERLSADPEVERLFRREALLANKIQHPGVVAVTDDDVAEDGCIFLVMPLLEGETLRARAARMGGKLPVAEVARIAHALLETLQAAHAMKIVHRDIKPENVFVTLASEVRILDFGIARFFETNESLSATRSGRTMGTPAFMAPEQALGRLREIDGQSDLWSVGATMFTLFSGQFVHEGESGSELLVRAATRKPRPLAEVAPEVPGAFCGVVDRALAFEKGARWADAEAMGRALADACETALGTEISNLEPLSAPPLDTLANIHDAATEHSAPLELRTTAAVESLARPALDAPLARARAESMPRFKLVRSMGVALALVAAVAGFLRIRSATPPAPPKVSPLAEPTSMLACPIFEASGVPEPAGWLGAAAAATVCERARVILGGSASRTLVPAELLSLPAQPVDHFPQDPYGEPDARERSLAASRHRAAAYIDGQVAKESAGFRVTLVLHRADGSETARANGQGRALYEAVRLAMVALISTDDIPKAKALDPTYVEWSRAKDVDSALALLDVDLAIYQNAGGVADECARLATRSAEIVEMRLFEQWRCAYTLGLALPTVALPPFDVSSSSGALAARARLEDMALRVDDPALVSELRKRFEEEHTPTGRTVLAETLACAFQASDPRQALDLAHLAVQSDPKLPLGGFCASWRELAMVAQDTASIGSAVDGWQAWVPWDSHAWLASALGARDAKHALLYARRAYTLSPFDGYVADVLADDLFGQGEREEVRNLALALGAVGFPAPKVESELLLVRLDASEARFGSALARATRTMEIGPSDSGWVRAQRLEIAWHALQIGDILGRSAEVADDIVTRFLDPQPPPIDANVLTEALRIPAICMQASKSVSKRCFAHFRALQSGLLIVPGTESVVDGGERYARGDFRGAARIWKPLLREPGMFAKVLSAAMETAFERSGDDDLVQVLESIAMSSGSSEYNGATLADVRAARRAANRGDSERARQFAHKVMTAWSVADESVPAVSEMHKLLARLR